MTNHDLPTADHVLKVLYEARHKRRNEALENLRPLANYAMHQLRGTESANRERAEAWLAIAALVNGLQARQRVPDTLWESAIDAMIEWRNLSS